MIGHALPETRADRHARETRETIRETEAIRDRLAREIAAHDSNAVEADERAARREETLADLPGREAAPEWGAGGASSCYSDHATHVGKMANLIHAGVSRAPGDEDGRGVTVGYGGEAHAAPVAALDAFEAGVKAVRAHYRGRGFGARSRSSLPSSGRKQTGTEPGGRKSPRPMQRRKLCIVVTHRGADDAGARRPIAGAEIVAGLAGGGAGDGPAGLSPSGAAGGGVAGGPALPGLKQSHRPCPDSLGVLENILR